MSGIVNKIKEAVHPDKSHHGAPEGTHGPHESRAANAMDPRVDSDRDNSRTMGTGRTAGQGEYGSSTTTGYGTGSAPEGTHGPHGSRVANAMDPRVDSDRDNSRTVGTGRTAGHGEYGSSTTGYGTGSTAEGVHGPHSSRVANAMDPRVDSDRDNSRTVGTGTSGIGSTGTSGYGQTGTSGIGSTGTSGFGSTGTSGGYSSTGAGSGATGMTGTHGAPAGTYGPHSSRMANAADPRVDSDRDGRGALGSSGGPGPAPNTAGPHKSDMANKLDPRVDSDLDHSRTVGGNKTYQQSGTLTGNRDPTDAAQVPPSVLRKHVGGPVIEHDDVTHHRERRNSIKSHQETFRGI